MNHTDPTGHYVCRSPKICEPPLLAGTASTDPRNLTPWIVAEANYLPTLPEGERIALGLEPAPHSPSTRCAVCSAHSFNELVKDGAPLDVKDKILRELGTTIQLGGVWFEYSTPGNILFGYYGSAWGFAPVELHAGAGFAQLQDYCRSRETPLGPVSLLFDTADDYYAIEFGIELYYEGYATDRIVTISEFTSLLISYENLSKMALRSAPLSDAFNPNWPYWQGYFYNDENVPQSELWFPSFQELR
ncbi:MAG: polymorphic toxin type 44 domain-containing protein [Anaerolineae bacterium]|nr:polymorphic toxin type 44 domain-containing protein [Anaerolineae bacterium]